MKNNHSNFKLTSRRILRLWLIAEILIGIIICFLPIIWERNFSEQTLYHGVILASVVIFISEIFRHFTWPIQIFRITKKSQPDLSENSIDPEDIS
jgi:hypothetical protein